MDAAIARLVRDSYDLRVKSFEIPQARADVLTASLRANPMVFGTASSVPYAPYSPQRPGEVNFSATVIYPFDVSHKRQAAPWLPQAGRAVIEANQDAVRIDLERCTWLTWTWPPCARRCALPRPAATDCGVCRN